MDDISTFKSRRCFKNIYYLFDYQIGYMYWRYFMWNFTGRQDDVQGRFDLHGNWISGINAVDSYILEFLKTTFQAMF